MFILEDEQVWGRYDLDNNRVELTEDITAESQDLLNFVATQILLNGGEVYTMQPDELPTAAPVVAIFRY